MTTHEGLSPPLIPRPIALISAKNLPVLRAPGRSEVGVEMTIAAVGARGHVLSTREPLVKI